MPFDLCVAKSPKVDRSIVLRAMPEWVRSQNVFHRSHELSKIVAFEGTATLPDHRMDNPLE